VTKPKTDPESRADNTRQKPDVGAIVGELLKAESLDELLAPEGVLKQVLGQTLEQMLQGELTEHLGYERYEAKGRNRWTAILNELAIHFEDRLAL